MGRGLVLGVVLLAAACETSVRLADPAPCSLANCAGCCAGDGQCLGLASQGPTQCGSGGGVCTACPSGQSCNSGQCGQASSCGVCAGCCTLMVCFDGQTDVSCGANGALCTVCPDTQHCSGGRCVSCTSANCAGCCDTFSNCVSGTADTDCGSGGNACKDCRLNFQACVGNRCQ